MYTDTSAVYGVSEQELYAEWQESGCGQNLAEWRAAQYRELGELNPLGGWDAKRAPDFNALAAQIERAA